jgi:hypothetical protein
LTTNKLETGWGASWKVDDGIYVLPILESCIVNPLLDCGEHRVNCMIQKHSHTNTAPVQAFYICCHNIGSTSIPPPSPPLQPVQASSLLCIHLLLYTGKKEKREVRVVRFLKSHFNLDFLYFLQHCFICRPSDSTVSEDARIEPGTVATSDAPDPGFESASKNGFEALGNMIWDVHPGSGLCS